MREGCIDTSIIKKVWFMLPLEYNVILLNEINCDFTLFFTSPDFKMNSLFVKWKMSDFGDSSFIFICMIFCLKNPVEIFYFNNHLNKNFVFVDIKHFLYPLTLWISIGRIYFIFLCYSGFSICFFFSLSLCPGLTATSNWNITSHMIAKVKQHRTYSVPS